MRLKRLEMFGYKSFASRTVFEFGEGMTAIVGPNGSGKSNIADAIRWVMGEQSPRSLRAQSTQDMIFAGSRGRARLGMAEVLITLDNSDGWIPIPFSEVTVGRRADRSGVNEYLLNGNRVRYRDLLEILGGAGLARSNYTVISQGMVDAALSLRPEARRALFEEAAGVSPHLRKRTEALGRISETERNLDRVTDILGEMRPRAHRLRRQAERASEHALLSQDLRELQRIWYGHEWQRIRRDLADADERVKQARARLEAQRAYARKVQADRDEIDSERTTLERTLSALAAQESQLAGQQETMRRDLAVLSERERLFNEQAASLDAELASMAPRRGITERETALASHELAQLEGRHRESTDELKEVRAALAQTEKARRGLEARRLEIRQCLSTATSRVARLRARALAIETQETQLATDCAEANRRLQALGLVFAQRAAQIARLQEHEHLLGQRLAEIQGRRQQLDDQLAVVVNQIGQAREAISTVRLARDQLVARRDLLERARQDLAGYYPGVRQVLSSRSGLAGILGTVASLVTVPAELELAIEAALEARLQWVVTERWQDADAAINHLRQTGTGRATFLPLDEIRPPSPARIRANTAVVGVASELVRCDPRIAPVVELLLGRVIVVSGLDDARRLLDGQSIASLFVTLQGEVVRPSGALTGGSRRKGASLLEQEREWRLLPSRIKARDGELAEAHELLTARNHERDRHRIELGDTSRLLASAQKRHERTLEALTKELAEAHELELERDWQTARSGRAREQLDLLGQEADQVRDQLGYALSEESENTSRLVDVEVQLEAARDTKRQQRSVELETRAALTQRMVAAQRNLLESLQETASQHNAQIRAKEAQRAGLNQKLEALAEQLASTSGRLVALGSRIGELGTQITPARERVDEMDRSRSECELRRAQSLDRMQEAEVTLERITLEHDRAEDRQTSLERSVEADLGPIDLPEASAHQLRLGLGDDIVTLPTVPSLPTGLREDIRHMRARLGRLGSINPESPQDYARLLERRTFLESQAADLKGSIASLHEVIEELDSVIERSFAETVTRVDKTFRTSFNTLFNGGSARLVLTEPADMSSTGVDIVVHPPGKRAQGLALLSGGERALTGVALVIALLRANPVPFCFLDEVDATLDEVNVRRLRDLLQEQAEDTQFVVITHNRNTIEAATTIFGISMGQQGVSQSVSLSFGEASVVEAAQA